MSTEGWFHLTIISQWPRTSTANGGSVLDRARALRNPTRAFARLAEFVLTWPIEILDISIAELGTRSNTSPATVSRFVRLLGYDNFRGSASLSPPALAGQQLFRTNLQKAMGRSPMCSARPSAHSMRPRGASTGQHSNRLAPGYENAITSTCTAFSMGLVPAGSSSKAGGGRGENRLHQRI